jgi:nitrate reductase delta subunit
MNRAAAFQAAALCLEYPDESLLAALPLLRATGSVDGFLDHLERTPLPRLQADYVDTFDLRRRCCLYLSYYTSGDTRKRGLALLQFRSAYRAAGFEIASRELPDHLAVVCEFAARRPDAGVRLLQRNRVGLELLAIALQGIASPYAQVIDLVRGVLPAPSSRELAAAQDLVRTGPPAEQVGIG